MVSFKRYKKGKPYVDDLELLGYSHDRLIEIISQTQKQITCSKCLNVTVLKKLGYGEIYSGQYGIYFKCHSCQKNVSISSKVDFNRDHELIEIDNFINNFNKDLKITQKQYDAIKSLIKNLRKELKDKRATMLMLSDGKSKYEKEKIYQEAQSVQIIDEGHFEDKYKVAFNFMEKYCYSSDQNSGVYRVADEVPIPGGYLDYWGDYNSSSMISHESKLNPNKTKDLEAIEEHHLKPFIKKKKKEFYF